MEKQTASRYNTFNITWLVISNFVLCFINGPVILLNCGQNPSVTLCLGLSWIVHLSLGTVILILNIIMLLFVIVFDRRQIGLGTIANMLCASYVTDFSCWFCGRFFPVGFFGDTVYKYPLLLLCVVVFAINVGIYLAVDLGESPYDAIPIIISKHVRRISYRTIRLIWDIAFIVGGTLLGVRPGIATLLLGFMLAPVITAVQRLFEKKLIKI